MIRVFDDYESLSRAAADLWVAKSQAAVAAKGSMWVALAGGHTPRRMYELMARDPWRDETAWDSMDIFWGDERCVPLEAPRSNAGMARRILWPGMSPHQERIHPVECADSPEKSARAYEKTIRTVLGPSPRFDLIFLGLGENGHTASLFPDTDALQETSRWVIPVHPAGEIQRITFTYPLLNAAACVVFLVSGKEKSAVLARVIEGSDPISVLPAIGIAPVNGELIILADREAASAVDVSK